MHIWKVSVAVALVCSSSDAYARCFQDTDINFLVPIDVDGESYRECLNRERKEATRDALPAMRHRAREDFIKKFVVGVGTDIFVPSEMGTISDSINSLVSSDYLTQEIQDGLNAKFIDYNDYYSSLVANNSISYEEYAGLVSRSVELDQYLQAAYATTSLLDEKKLIEELRSKLDYLAKMLPANALLKNGDLTVEQKNQIIQISTNVTKETYQLTINQNNQTIVNQAGRPNPPEDGIASRRKRFRDNQKQIDEVAFLSKSVTSFAVNQGWVAPREARKTNRLINGFQQASTAANMINAGQNVGYMSAAGPYGMAFAAMTSFSGAFADDGPSADEQIMSMLASISRQISDLQDNMNDRFDGIESLIAESEYRIMGRLSEIMESNAEIDVKLAQFNDELTALRNELQGQARLEQLNSIRTGQNSANYYNDLCLQQFGNDSSEIKNECLGYFQESMKKFTDYENSVYVGSTVSKANSNIPVEDRLVHVVNSINSLGIDTTRIPGAIQDDPIHGPMLTNIVEPIRLFFSLNPNLASDPNGAFLIQKIKTLQGQRAQLVEFLGSSELREKLIVKYKAEYGNVLAQMQTNLLQFQFNRAYSQSDEIVNLQRDIRFQGISFEKLKDQFTGRNDKLYTKIQNIDDRTDYLFPNAEFAGAKPHTQIQNRLSNFDLVAKLKDANSDFAFLKWQKGHYWVQPCGKTNDHPSFPILRSKLGELFHPKLAKLSLVSPSAFSICYSAKPTQHRARISQNGKKYRKTIFSRIRSMGFLTAYTGTNAFCRKKVAKKHFKSNYTKFSEFPKSDFEKCHKGNHLHHEMNTSALKLTQISFKLGIKLSDYSPNQKDFPETIALPTGRYDRCFLPHNDQNQSTNLALLQPFRLQYPLAISKPCVGIEEAFLRAADKIRPNLIEFFENQHTVSRNDPTEQILIDSAIETIISQGHGRSIEHLMAGIFGASSQYNKLNELADLLNSTSNFRGIDQDNLKFVPDLAALRRMAGFTLFDQDRKTLKPITELFDYKSID